jgi:hypothetical protein
MSSSVPLARFACKPTLAAGARPASALVSVRPGGWGGPVHLYTVSSLIGDLIRAHNVTVGEGGAGELLPHARLHDLRHVHATTLLLAGGSYSRGLTA